MSEKPVQAVPSLEEARKARDEATGADGLPVIETSERPTRHITADAMNALHHANRSVDVPFVYVRQGGLTRVRDDENGRPLVRPMTDDDIRFVLNRAANFKNKSGKDASASKDVIAEVRVAGDWPFPPLSGIVETPSIRPDGTLLIEPGYDAPTRLLHRPSKGLMVPTPADVPTQRDRDEAVRTLREVVCDFPFVEDGEANLLGLLLSVVARPAIEGQVPMAIFTATKSRTGKGLLSKVVSIVATGGEVAMRTPPTREDEWRKEIMTVVLSGQPFVLLDETEVLHSASLQSILTTGRLGGRKLGGNEDADVEHRSIWAALGNNIQLRGDMPARVYRIPLDARTSHPERRTGFRYAHLEQHVKAHRGKLLGALLTIARAWYADDCPQPNPIPFGGFESFVQVVGGMLGNVGVDGFLSGLHKQIDESNVEDREWSSFVGALAQHFPTPTLAADIAKAYENDDELRDTAPSDLADKLAKGGNLSTKIGHALRKRKDTRYGDENWRVEEAGTDSRGGRTYWRFVRDEGSEPDPATQNGSGPPVEDPATDEARSRLDHDPPESEWLREEAERHLEAAIARGDTVDDVVTRNGGLF